jgi:flagellar biosynthesis protein FlhA
MVRLTQRTIPQLAIISVDEVPLRITLTSFDVVRLETAMAE